MIPEDKSTPEGTEEKNTGGSNQANPDNNTSQNGEIPSKGRRDVLKALAGVPVIGAMALGVLNKKNYDDNRRKEIKEAFNPGGASEPIAPIAKGELIRLGVVGFGIRGKQLMRAIGFAQPSQIDKLKEGAKEDSRDTRYKDYLEQEDLNVVVTGVCDIFDTYANEAIEAGANIHREGIGGKMGTAPKRYLTYKELLAADDIDAVIIAAPDHWHAQMTIDAAKAGKHVYVEKPLSWTVPETYDVVNVIKETGIVFQLGHQGRQVDSYRKAKEIIDAGLLGPISMIEMCTNRNDPNGAWVYPIHETANPKTIDWKQFEGPENRVKEYMDYMSKNGLMKYVGPEDRVQFSLERFFRWRCWWDYSTGLSGDLLTHEYDAVNQILGSGIPKSASSSGGVYFFKDGRTVPDVLQTVFEFPKQNFSLLYSATLASNRNRGKVIMGHDASMEVADTLTVTVDPASTRYKDKIESGLIKTNVPFYTYIPGKSNVDAITSATELYFAQRGLLYAYVGGKRYDTTFLHMREWIDCIRDRSKKPSCGPQEAFEEAITAHMGTRSYLEGRTMYWDEDNQEIVRG